MGSLYLGNQHIIIPQSPSWVAHCRLQIVKTFVAGEGILAQRQNVPV